MSRKAARSRRASKSASRRTPRKPVKLSKSIDNIVNDVKRVVEPLDLNTFRDRLATPPEVSAYTRIPTGTLSNWRNADPPVGPPFLKCGHHVRYRMTDVLAWIEAGGSIARPKKDSLDELAEVAG